MSHYHNQPSGTVDRARALRRAATESEKRLLRALRETFPHCKWRFQMPLGPYYADFACFAERLIIEVDGGQHAETSEYDAARTRYMQREGYRVMRFWNNDVMGNVEGVVATIADLLPPLPLGEGRDEGDLATRRPSPSPFQPSAGPLPLPRGEEK